MQTITPVATPRPTSPPTSTTAPAIPLAGPAAAVPPLHLRSPEQLKDGLVVKVEGAGSDDLAVARLIQDGAQFIARSAGTTMGLATVTINDRSADSQGALGLATFQGNKGWFGLSQRSTKGVMEGITRLRATPFDQWTEAQRQAFVQSNETILHEAGHVTLPAYDNANISAWRGASRPFEEGLTEVVTMRRIAEFMKDEFGVDVGSVTDRISQSTSAYTRYSERIERMLAMGGDGSHDAIAAAASHVADNVRADQRFITIAERIGSNLGGPTAPKEIVTEIAKTLEGFVEEKNGTRTRLMELQAALVDHKAGRPVDLAAVLASSRALATLAPPSLAPPEIVGPGPIADPVI